MSASPDPRWLTVSPTAAAALAAGEVGNPFSFLGPHRLSGGSWLIRAWLPGAEAVSLREEDGSVRPMQAIEPPGLFAAFALSGANYRLLVDWPDGTGGRRRQDTADPYSYGLLLGELDLHLFSTGKHQELAHCLGAQAMRIGGIDGVRFAVWAPQARRVSVIGAFNTWNGLRHPMRRRVENGVWELFVPGLLPGEHYQYELLGATGAPFRKADPLALQDSPAPAQASVVADPQPFTWSDAQWLAERPQRQAAEAPMSIYEVHAGSWRREPGQTPDWNLLTRELIPYVQSMGFTHVELLPITAHPFGGSWGYQPLSMFAPQPDWGPPEAFAKFVDACHAAQIGVLLDWVPAHFPSDAHGLARFDGSALYEHADPREGHHPDWNTLIYNFGRHEVAGFLIASALHWLKTYHVDGLRVDAVASMLYRDYSRKAGEWTPNHEGGRENLEAVAFLKDLNRTVAEVCPGALMIAEESTSWPGVTRAVEQGGLGFSAKWNMGWMNDTLAYVKTDPIYRSAAHSRITFGFVYAWDERFVLPLSHDEVVHLKGALIAKQPGDAWRQAAGLRALYGWMWAHPGHKLLFMGGEIGQKREWNHDRALDWSVLDDPLHRGVQAWVRDLNHGYRDHAALHECDARPEGFQWLVVDAKAESLFAICRHAGDAPPVIAVSNFTPVPRPGYQLGVPRAGRWREILNSDAAEYGGSGVGNLGGVTAVDQPFNGQPASLVLTAPPLSTIWLVWDGA